MYDTVPQLLKVWVPAVLLVAVISIALIEARVAYGYASGI